MSVRSFITDGQRQIVASIGDVDDKGCHIPVMQIAGKAVALADPTASPYGRASTRAMEKLSLDTGKFRPLVLGNVDQVATVFVRGDADLAFVSAARADRLGAPFVLTLDAAVPPISHSAALLSDDEASQAFWDWLATQDARAMIAADGYSLP